VTSTAELEADANSRHKADLIAEYLWRCGLTVADVAWLPYTDRHGPSRARLARAAYRAVIDPCPKRGDHSPPSSVGSDSWRHVLAALADLADRERYDFDAPPRDLLDERDEWLPTPHLRAVQTVDLPDPGEPPEEPPDEIPAEMPPPMTAEQLARNTPPPRERRPRPLDLVPYDTRPALVTAGSPPLLHGQTSGHGPPRGWHELAALGPLEPERPCRWCGNPAIVGTLNGWRCWAHWPVRGDPRGDWGWNLNWAPNPGKPPCLAAACYCGRCPHYDPSGQSLKQGARAGVGAPETRHK
jgi:hypothetical protein